MAAKKASKPKSAKQLIEEARAINREYQAYIETHKHATAGVYTTATGEILRDKETGLIDLNRLKDSGVQQQLADKMMALYDIEIKKIHGLTAPKNRRFTQDSLRHMLSGRTRASLLEQLANAKENFNYDANMRWNERHIHELESTHRPTVMAPLRDPKNKDAFLRYLKIEGKDMDMNELVDKYLEPHIFSPLYDKQAELGKKRG